MKILISGASRGIGLAEAKRLSAHELYLVATAKKSFSGSGIRGNLFGHDLADVDGINAFCQELKEQTDAIDVLVNNVGIYKPKKFEDLSDAEIIEQLSINLRSHILLTKRLLPFLRKSKNPHIVFMSSMAAKSSIVGESVYGATKAAITNFANILRNELSGQIKVSVMHAWGVNTWGAKEADSLLRPEDIAEALEFIITRRSEFLVESIDMSSIRQWRGGQAPWSPK
jgi:ribitol 2-dehydrogenase